MQALSRRQTILGTLACTLFDLGAARSETASAPVAAKAASDGFHVLESESGSVQLLPDEAAKTACLAYGGEAPAPLLRYKLGDDIRIRLSNRLDQPTSLHFHGLRAENAVDGVAGLTQKPVQPGQDFDIRFKAADSGLYLYRPAGAPFAAEQIARGLAGLMIVDEAAPPDIDADQMLLFQDWKLDAKGAAAGPFNDEAEGAGAGRIGTLISAASKPVPQTHVFAPGARVRLRIANAASARIMILVFDANIRPLVMAIDGQPCDPFEPVRRTLPIAPGARFDLMMDLPSQENAASKLVLRDGGGADRDLAIWTTKGAKAKERAAIASLPLNPLLPPEIKLGQAKKLEVAIETPKGAGWLLNGEKRSYAGKPLFSVKKGTPVSIGFSNKSNVAIPVAIHGYAVRLLHDLDDGWEPYWRNAVIVPPGHAKHIAFLADAPGKWAIRSDIAEQEAAGLATWFEVT